MGSNESPLSRPFTLDYAQPRPKLRQATLILPKTGERIKKAFTLRSVRTLSPNGNDNGNGGEQEPLLTRSSSFRPSKPRNASFELIEGILKHQYEFWTSNTGIGVFKCSLAYTLGSLATFVAPISGLLGRNDGKHMVATVTVYFHSARSAGSMAEATVMAMIAFAYAAFVSFSSMAVSIFFRRQGLLELGHAVVLVFFCGGGLGLVGWTKQRLGNPLVNVACSLTSLAIITVLTKEGAVQEGRFSYIKVLQVLKMIGMGMFAAIAVNFLVKPQLARRALRQDFKRITDLQENILTVITRSFLSGQESDVRGASFTSLTSRYRSTFNSMVKDLREAKFEHYIQGTESIHKAEKKLVKCIERLGQSLTGLRSAAETQFELLSRSHQGTNTPVPQELETVSNSPSILRLDLDHIKHLQPITEEPEDVECSAFAETSRLARTIVEPQTSSGPSEIFSLFIRELGPSMKSLAFTLKGVLNELPFEPGSEHTITVNNNFRRSLLDAKQLFSEARQKALESLYRSRAIASAQSPEEAADYEEVAASCGHFSSSLQDFAEDTIVYLDILEELDAIVDENHRSWTWLYSWHKWRWIPSNLRSADPIPEMRLQEETAARRMSMALPTPRQEISPGLRTKNGQLRTFWYEIMWRMFSFLRREDIRFALKVGIGALLYAMFSFIPETQPIYSHWRGEWGLLSYMLVCSMTIGASNTTGLQRFLGTCLGALLAVTTWIISNKNPWLLCFLGWIVSLGCFYIIVGRGKGPMGRFIMLTYNLSALYAYSLSVRDDDDDDDEGGISPVIWEIVLHRVAAVLVGCLWGLIITRIIYPISARKKLKQGIALLWLRMGLIWKRDPLSILIDHDEERNQYMDIRESLELQRFLGHLEGLRESASHEFELRGPFPNDLMKKILEATRRVMGAFIAMNTIIVKDLKASPGEAELLRYAKDERTRLSAGVCHLFSVLASSMQLAYPITDAVPSIEPSRDQFLAKLFEFRKNTLGKNIASDEDYELLYAYALVTGQLSSEIDKIAGLLEELYGIMDEESLRLR
ncbi:uncharacterized protein PV09_03338 [Verruconis gallopava]|uniref:Integral membrane bound transporter domain-containing protein n=1 Tax=Verruconis gallopava TaxID=253628 RepID=A0A0D2B2E1_9PEZI|nr:uncharacterized protein PV09_03338 [Verruconis gallopava]KIW05449.1 hypothetical protein PV09_03338 [Verruconis gallopava]